jgi:hypothetical protein
MRASPLRPPRGFVLLTQVAAIRAIGGLIHSILSPCFGQVWLAI